MSRISAPWLSLAAAAVVVVVASLLFPVATLAGSDEKAPAFAVSSGPGGTRNLTLAPNLSFTDDSSSAFPIRGVNLQDGRIASDRPTAVFFGTSHCWNTNREAERFVALYAKEKDTARFLVVDLERPSSDQRALVSRLYRGAIPSLAFLDRSGSTGLRGGRRDRVPARRHLAAGGAPPQGALRGPQASAPHERDLRGCASEIP